MTMTKQYDNDFGIYNENGPGMEYIHALRKASTTPDPEEMKPDNLVIGTFGIVGDDGREHKINWKIDGWRRKKDWAPEAPSPSCRYSESLLDSMFKGWK